MSSFLGRVIEARELTDRLEASYHAMDIELKAAADVQRWLLPHNTLSTPMSDIAASYKTARHSGGDYYDVGELPDGRLGVFIADVSGKGAAAAVLMAVLRTIIHDEVDRSKVSGPGQLLDYADTRLCALGLAGRGLFVTAFSCVLDPANGTLTYSSAGHNPPRILSVRERLVQCMDEARTTPLGMLDKPCKHTEEVVAVEPGDLLLFYTDGITEARSPGGEFFGTVHLDEILRGLPDPLMPSYAVNEIIRAVSEFMGDGPLSDDQTILALRCRDQCGEVIQGESYEEAIQQILIDDRHTRLPAGGRPVPPSGLGASLPSQPAGHI
ncbi:MAG: SpoIIE family protein phosphatase [Phycisphaerales bacterium]|nr:SpoIIE family protein phosphatase [Phycisphaerales bacterium]